jgi:hypothetical protein
MERVNWRCEKVRNSQARRNRDMIIIGCDLHTRFQQIAMLDAGTGEVVEKKLEHENGRVAHL